ncbi:MAG: SRPBCC family protein [Pseudomonadota bacterium]|uniref:SRPBCC family protein n=1 Tax=Sphingomonas sp. ERG5 TaxID=1381597 RepID=UPI00054B507F|nr:SRPBCC family protein [Sphingomonas sp. ERG5]
MTERSITHATFTVERIYAASPERVFQAHADPAIKRKWYAEGEGWIIDSYASDFRVGGMEITEFRFGDGPPMRNDTLYLDIVPNQRMITSYAMMIGGDRISASLASIELTPVDGGTRLVFTEQGAYLDGFDNPAQREAGSRELLEALAKAVEGETVSA